ncbi:MAG: hypothetical protein HC815_26910 [Richelia sp. RM1_1_1]|nr:hypothetical protein [Richelia sp. RM1_1_1]
MGKIFDLKKVKDDKTRELVTAAIKIKHENVTEPCTTGAFLSHRIGHRFNVKEVGFAPYDLRHAYAIRGYRMQFNTRIMTQYMGCTTRIHERVYQQYMNDNTKSDIYREIIGKSNHAEDKEADNKRLKENIKSLKLQIEINNI